MIYIDTTHVFCPSIIDSLLNLMLITTTRNTRLYPSLIWLSQILIEMKIHFMPVNGLDTKTARIQLFENYMWPFVYSTRPDIHHNENQG